MPRTPIVATVALLVALATGCSSTHPSAHPAPAPSTSTTAAPAPTTTSPASTTTTAAPATTTTAAADSFTPVAIPARPGDVDGDGHADQVTISWNASGATVTAALTRLGTQAIPVQVDQLLLADPSTHPTVLGVVDIDADGYSEIMVQVGQGASTTAFTILKLVGGRLSQVMLNGTAATLDFGGSVEHFTQFGCGGGQIVVAGWSTTDPSALSYRGERDVYRLSGTQLSIASRTTTTFTTNGAPPTPTQLAAAGYLVHCPPID